MSSAGFQQLSKRLLATNLVLLITPPLLTPSSAQVRLFHQPKLVFDLKYTIFSYQTILEMYGSCSVCNESSICLPTQHPMSGPAQAHLSHLAWYIVSRDVPNNDA